MNGRRAGFMAKIMALALATTALIALAAPAAKAHGVTDFYNDPYAHWVAPRATCDQWSGVTATGAASTKFYPAYWRTTLYRFNNNTNSWVMLDNTKLWVYGGGAQHYSNYNSSGRYGIYHYFIWRTPSGWSQIHYQWEECQNLSLF
jgi:hypothetical protein